MKQIILLAAATLITFGSASAAHAQYVAPGFTKDQDLRWETYSSLGILGLVANEYVYDGTWTTSHLIWKSTAPVLSAGARAKLDGGWAMNFGIEAATSGKSNMEDYDWIKSFGHTNAENDWTDRSQHDDTNLDHFIRGDIFFGYDIASNDTTSFVLGGGLKYTDVQWTAKGGDLVYSVGTFRDTTQTLAEGLKAITYRQTIPAFYLGFEFETTQDQWSFAAAAQVGKTLYAKADDDHWLRNLNFVDELKPSLIFVVKSRIAYALVPLTKLFVSLAYDKTYTGRGDTVVTNTSTNAKTQYSDAAGADIETLAISIGMTSKF